MAWRKFLVRGLVLTVLAAMAFAGWMYYHWTNPTAVRRQVVAHLQEHFVGADVRLESAQLSLLGGICFSELRFVKRDDPEKVQFLFVPSGTIYHDKEQLLNGTLAVRKLELHEPRFHVIRDKDGKLNLEGVLGEVTPDVPIPTIVIQDGTITIEDRMAAAGVAPLKIEHVNLTLLNDPLTVLAFQGKATSELLGALEVTGTWDRVTSATAVKVEAPGVPIGPVLLHRLALYEPKTEEHLKQLTGTLQFHGDFHYQPECAKPFTHELQAHLTGGKLVHAKLPSPLHDLDVLARCEDGRLTIEKAAARSGEAALQLHGWVGSLDAHADFGGELKLDGLTINNDLLDRLPDNMNDIRDFAPAGTVNLTLHAARQNGNWRKRCVIRPVDFQATFDLFPYTLEKIKGTIDHEEDDASASKILRLDLVGYSANKPIHVKGTIQGVSPKPTVNVDVWGHDIPLDEKLIAALPDEYQELAQSFCADGMGDFIACIRRAQGDARFSRNILVRFHDCTVCYDRFPYPLEKVGGFLGLQGQHWEFRDFRGSHKGGEVEVKGHKEIRPDGVHAVIDIEGQNLLLDEEMERALTPRGRQKSEGKLKAVWKALNPTGRMNLACHVDQPAELPDDLDITVSAGGFAIQPSFFPYLLEQARGTVRYTGDRAWLEDCCGRHGETILKVDTGQVYVKPGGGFWIRLPELQANPLIPDEDLLQALPGSLQHLMRSLDLHGGLSLQTELVVDAPADPGAPPIVFWDGGVALRDAEVRTGVPWRNVNGQAWCRGRHNGQQLDGVVGNIVLDQAVLFKQPFRNVHTEVEIPKGTPDVVRFPNIKAQVFGGDIGGEARIELGPTMRYDLNLSALQLRLEEFGRHNIGPNTQFSGQAMARLWLSGRGSDVEGLEGRGSIDVPSGRMYNFPLLLDLLKVLGLRAPDRTAFEEAHAAFRIRGSRVHVSRLDLYGNAISLGGQGEMNLDGTDVELDFYAVWGRIMEVLPAAFRELPAAISQQFLKIKMRGQVGNIHITKELVPMVVDPLERLLKRSDGKKDGKNNGREAQSAQPKVPVEFLPK